MQGLLQNNYDDIVEMGTKLAYCTCTTDDINRNPLAVPFEGNIAKGLLSLIVLAPSLRLNLLYLEKRNRFDELWKASYGPYMYTM